MLQRADAIYCSDRCRARRYRDDHRTDRSAAAILAEIFYARCAGCGTHLWDVSGYVETGQFHRPRPDQRYCSTRCRVAAHRQRRRAANG